MHCTHVKILQAEARGLLYTGGQDSSEPLVCTQFFLNSNQHRLKLNLLFWRRGKQNCFEILCEKQPVVLEQTAACSYHSFV